jgi:hypothetical protein
VLVDGGVDVPKALWAGLGCEWLARLGLVAVERE